MMNKLEGQGGYTVQDGCKTRNDVRCRATGSKESTRDEVIHTWRKRGC